LSENDTTKQLKQQRRLLLPKILHIYMDCLYSIMYFVHKTRRN